MSADVEPRVDRAAETELLCRVPLFQNLRPAQAELLHGAAARRRFSPGSVLSAAGRPSAGLILVLNGRVSRAGVEIAAGEWLDETEALEVHTAAESVAAVDEVDCLILPARAVHDAVRADPELGVALLRQASRLMSAPDDEGGPQLLKYAIDLREMFREGERRQEALRQSVLGAVRALVGIVEAKDPAARGHAARAARTARKLATALGQGEEDVGHAALGGLLHDIGFVAVDGAILRKTEALTQREQAQLRAHPEVGARIVGNIESLQPVAPFVLHHHERYDGHGYPEGLPGRSIPFQGRLMAAVEAYEGLRSQDAAEDARRLRAMSGRELDPEIVRALADLVERGGLAE